MPIPSQPAKDLINYNIISSKNERHTRAVPEEHHVDRIKKTRLVNNSPDDLHYNNNLSHLEETKKSSWSFMANFFSDPQKTRCLMWEHLRETQT